MLTASRCWLLQGERAVDWPSEQLHQWHKMDSPGYSLTCVLKPAGNIIICHFLRLYWRKKKVWVTDPERTFPHQLQILNSSQELHYQSSYNKKTLEREVLNDQRLPWKMVEKWPIYFLPPFGVPKWIFFIIQQSVHCLWMDTRGQSECRQHRQQAQRGANLLGVR